MKKLITALLLCSLLLTVGCSKPTESTPPSPTDIEEVTVTTPSDVPEPEPEPTWQPGTPRLDNMGVFIKSLFRGEEVTITGEYGDYYVVDVQNCEGTFVEKRFIRTEADEPFSEKRTVYAVSGAKLYPSSYLVGAYEKLAQNTKLTVVDELHGTAAVEIDGKLFFIASKDISDSKIKNNEGGGNGGNGNGGAADGGDISLSRARLTAPALRGDFIVLENNAEEKPLTYPCVGTAFADDTELYMLITQTEQTLMITEYNEDSCIVYDGKNLGTIARWAVILEKTDEYERWKGFTKSGTRIYDNASRQGEGKKPKVNSEVEVVFELSNELYVVIYKDKIAFAPTDGISKEKNAVNNGGAGGSNNGDGGGEWTPPAL